MSKKLIQAAAGNAGGEPVYVEDVFSTYVYEGTGSALDITNNIDLDGEGGLVWIKNRPNTSNHALFDTERGAEKLLFSDDSAAEQDRTADNDSLGAFNSDGFSLQASSGNRTNESGSDFVSWSFRKQAGFFDVVTWTGDGTSNRQITHNLGSVPGCIIVKRLNSTANWAVWHRGFNSASTNGGAFLNLSNAFGNEALFSNNSSAFSDSYFLVSSSANRETNGYLDTYVAYVFAHDDQSFGDNSDESIIKCGSYTGIGNNPQEINLGWEAQFVLIKSSSHADSWDMFDVMRGMTVGGNDESIDANRSSPSVTDTDFLEPYANGFRLTSGSVATNYSGRNYIYIAIRRPMKTPESGTEVFAPKTRSGSGAIVTTGAGFTPDVFYNFDRTYGGSNGLFDRLRGRGILQTMFTAVENATSPAIYDLVGFDTMDGVELGGAYNINMTGSGRNFVDYYFKRATGFFDVVAYTGDGSGAKSFNHNLGVIPELMIVKGRNYSDSWYVYVGSLGSSNRLKLESTVASGSAGTLWNSTSPTATQFTVGSGLNASSETNIVYLFATLAGVSKVGSYTGTGTTNNIDCGFSSSARFVVVKRTSSTGDWYVWDSARGITTGLDPFLKLNTSDAEGIPGSNIIEPYSSGFTLTSNAGTAINGSGSSFIFLAIA